MLVCVCVYVCVCVSVCVCERERERQWQRETERARETDSEQRFAMVYKKPSEEIEQERKHSSWQRNNVSISPKRCQLYLSQISFEGLFSSIYLFQ